MNTKTKLFYQSSKESMDDQINNFLSENSREYVDVRFAGVDNNFSTQASYVALLVYKERIY